MKLGVVRVLGALCLIVAMSNCNYSQSTSGRSGDHRYTNSLVNESSPYLLQHAHNPVNWFPWKSETIERAEELQKLMVISVGYSACHWCHVMEAESFEDSLVAGVMNENFISIKVDKEERPDVDKIYMDAAQLITGRRGWPLNVIALPDGRPIFAGTYFSKQDWLKILNHHVRQFREAPERLYKIADQITKGIQDIEKVSLSSDSISFSQEQLEAIHKDIVKEIDPIKGGRRGVQKFPNPGLWRYLMNYYYFSKDEKALSNVNNTLKAMASGGIYDHLGGGFARYTVDSDWKVPHFEKMLYDNAQLVSLYSRAYQLTKEPLYKEVVMETLSFIDREMTSEQGTFYTSINADSEGEEGKFYVWSEAEVRSILGDKSDAFVDYYNITKDGNWEDGKNILFVSNDPETIRTKYDLDENEFRIYIQQAKSKLFAARTKRVYPTLDDKILTSLNALMIIGYLDAYRVFHEESFLHKALQNADFLLKHAKSGKGRLTRNYKDGISGINGFLDDYSFMIQACIGLYEATFEEKWLLEAKQLCEYTIAHFLDKESGMFYYTSDEDPKMINRKMELYDNEIPSSNSSMARNLYYLNTYLYKNEYLEIALQMLRNIHESLSQQPVYYCNWAILMLQLDRPLYEVAIVGKDWSKLKFEFDKYFLPNVVYLGGTTEGSLELLTNKLVDGRTTIYVCENKSCRMPVTETIKALKLMDQDLLKGVVDY